MKGAIKITRSTNIFASSNVTILDDILYVVAVKACCGGTLYSVWVAGNVVGCGWWAQRNRNCANFVGIFFFSELTELLLFWEPVKINKEILRSSSELEKSLSYFLIVVLYFVLVRKFVCLSR